MTNVATTTSGPVTVREELTGRAADPVMPVTGRASWGAIWAGFFTILGIEAVLTTLMIGVFGAVVRPGAGSTPAAGFAIGIALWFFLETIFAYYVGGRVTGLLARPMDDGWSAGHALAVWGFASVMVLWALINAAGAAAATMLELLRMGMGLIENGTSAAGSAADVATWVPIYLFVVLGASYLTARAGVMTAVRYGR